MIHYNVWFSFNPDADDEVQLAKTRGLLDDFKSRGMIHDFCLLRNRGVSDETRLPKFHVVIEFQDEAQFGLPFAEVERLGVRMGNHGAMIEQVDEFVVEVFEQI